MSAAGWCYAAFGVALIGARAAFSYGANHWFEDSLGRWLSTNHIPVAALTDALIFMAIVTVMTRTVGLTWRAHSINKDVAIAEDCLPGDPIPVNSTAI